MRIIISIFLLICSFSSTSQINHSLNWIVGAGNSDKINFSSTVPVITTFNHNYKFYFDLGTSCISDSIGNLVFICNGYSILNSAGDTIDNGDTITPKKICEYYDGSSIIPQSSIILPFENNLYYVLTPTVSDSIFVNGWFGSLQVNYFDRLLYNKVDMNLNGGLGKVIKKSIPLLQDIQLSRSQTMACRHSDGKNWWLLTQARDSNKVYKFIVSKDSIYNMGAQTFGQNYWGQWDFEGQTMFSNDGKKYATCAYGRNVVFICDFDRCTGELTNPITYNLPVHSKAPTIPDLDTLTAGLCFSPDGNLLYVNTDYNLYQLDLNDPDTATQWFHVANMDTTYQQFQQWATIYPSPDDKLVIGNWNGLGKAMSTVNNPNIKGAGCGFCPKCLQFPLIGAGNPPCMPNYALGIDSSNLNCTPVRITLFTIGDNHWEVYPNPTSSIFYFRNAERKIKEIYNSIGQFIFSTTRNEMDVSYFSKGMYYLKCEGQTKKVIIE